MHKPDERHDSVPASSKFELLSPTTFRPQAWRPSAFLVAILLAVVALFALETVASIRPEWIQWPAGEAELDRTRFYVELLTLIFLAVYVRDTARMADASSRALVESQEARAEALAPRVMVYFATDSGNTAEIVVSNLALLRQKLEHAHA